MMPKVLWETTLNPKTRRLLRVEVADQLVTDQVINELMGKDASARFRFIMDRADEAEELDVSPASTIYTFVTGRSCTLLQTVSLRAAVLFHNGTPIAPRRPDCVRRRATSADDAIQVTQ